MSQDPGSQAGELARGRAQLEAFDTHVQMTARRRWTMLLIALGEFVDGYDLIVIGGALLLLKPQFHLSASETGFLGAAAFIGAALGLLVSGDVVDRIGRRNVFLYNFAFFVVFAIVAAFVANYAELLTMRILLGAVIGTDIATSMTFLGEISPRRSRGGWTGAMPQVAWTIGALVSLLMALLLFHVAGANAWRWMFGFGAVPALVVLIGRRTIPESPRWLITEGRTAEAESAMRKLGLVWAADKEAEAVVPAGAALRSGSQGSYLAVFEHPHRAQAILAIVIVALTPFVGGAAGVLSPYILHYVGLLGATASLEGSMFIWCGGLVGAVVAFHTIDRIGRLVSTAISTIGSCVVLVLLTQLTGFHAAFVALYVVVGALTWFGASSFWALPTELLPTYVRARGQGLGNGLSRGVVAATTWIVPTGIAAFGFTPMILIMAASGVPLGVYALLSRRYEPRGRDLDEIAPPEALVLAPTTLEGSPLPRARA